MKLEMKRKIICIGIIGMFIIIGMSTISTGNRTQFENDEEKPDFVVDRIEWRNKAECWPKLGIVPTIKNIGGPFKGETSDIEILVWVQGEGDQAEIYTPYRQGTPDYPGMDDAWFFWICKEPPAMRLKYEVCIIVNPNEKIQEENYTNNYRSATYWTWDVRPVTRYIETNSLLSILLQRFIWG